MDRHEQIIRSRLVFAAGLSFAIGVASLRAQTTQPNTRPAAPSTTQPARPPTTAPEPKFPDKRDRAAEIVARIAAETHGSAHWRKQLAVQADIAVRVGEKSTLEGTMLIDVHSDKARLQLKDGTVLVFDGEKRWLSPAAARLPGVENAAFHLKTWPWLLAAPFKMQDTAGALTAYRTWPLQGQPFDTFTWTMKKGPDSNGDWRLVYVDQRTHLLHALGNVTIFGKAAENPQVQAHAVTFDDMQAVDGVFFPTAWTFWNWTKDFGIEGESIGKTAISNIKFVKPSDDAFVKPADAREDSAS